MKLIARNVVVVLLRLNIKNLNMDCPNIYGVNVLRVDINGKNHVWIQRIKNKGP